jgi:1-acyl-sn-glycerol-3-phosphate acyltransferase
MTADKNQKSRRSTSSSMTRKIGHVLYFPYKWLIFMPFLTFSTLFLGTMAVFLAFVTTPKIASLCGVVWSRLNSYLTPMIVKTEGMENIDKNQSYIIACNHQSHFDIFVLYGWLGIDFKWVMKQELRKVPALGIACDKVGHIYIDRSNSKAAVASINAARKKITGGTSVLFFPEGTRSRHGKLGSFKKGAFKFAVTMGLPILPITIIGTNAILPSRTIKLFPGRARMIVHPPIDISGYDEKNIRDLMQKTHEVILSGLPENYGRE